MAEIKAKVVLILWTDHIKHYWKVQSRYRSKNIYGQDINIYIYITKINIPSIYVSKSDQTVPPRVQILLVEFIYLYHRD